LEKSWAGPFRKSVLPLIQEEPFRPFYCPDNGRPNVPVAILTGLCILKELHNLTDQEVLGSLEFDLRWQYAFDITVSEGHICQKTLHNFRVLVTSNEQAGRIFQGITDDLIADAGYGSGNNILEAQEREVDLVAPITSGRAPDPEKCNSATLKLPGLADKSWPASWTRSR